MRLFNVHEMFEIRTHYIQFTLVMTSAQVVETSVNDTSNSPSQGYTHPDDHNVRTGHILLKNWTSIHFLMIILVNF